jgi:outer membrane lipoprotein-sorting protein
MPPSRYAALPRPSRRSFALAAVSLCAGALLLSPPLAPAQGSDADPRTAAVRVAAEVQAFADRTPGLEAAFTQTYVDRVYRRRVRSRGVMAVSRPGQLRFDYLGGDGKVVVSDGRTLTVYEPMEDGPAQVLQRPVVEGAVPSALAILSGQARIDRDFRFRLRRSSSWDGPVLELRPRTPEPAYRRVLLYVDPVHAGVVRRVLIQDHDGNLNRFDFTRTRYRAVDASRFAFHVPAGARML